MLRNLYEKSSFTFVTHITVLEAEMVAPRCPGKPFETLMRCFSDFLKQLYSNTPLTKTVPEETILGFNRSSRKINFLKILENSLKKIIFFNDVILEYACLFTCRKLHYLKKYPYSELFWDQNNSEYRHFLRIVIRVD